MPDRRRLLQTLGAFAAVGAGGWALLSGGRANAYYDGPTSDHFDGVRFFNPSGVRPKGPGAFLKWQLGDRGESWPRSFPSHGAVSPGAQGDVSSRMAAWPCAPALMRATAPSPASAV